MKISTRVSLFIALVCCSGAMFVAIHRMHAAATAIAAVTITVQDSGDGPANAANCPGAGCRLRDALAAAASGDTINFDPSVTGTITLTSGALTVATSVTIDGPGANTLAVSGNNADRVFVISAGKTIAISGLTITNGQFNSGFGGGIYNDHATLTVTNCAISGNTANYSGGIENDGSSSGSATLTITNSTLVGNFTKSGGSGLGGAISNNGKSGGNATMTVDNCTLSGNSADSSGGGVVNYGVGGSATLTTNNSTFSGNSAKGGGAIANFDGTATINNCTLSGNFADSTGGGVNNGGTLTIKNSTFSGNLALDEGASIFNVGSLTIGSTILKSGDSSPNITDGGTVTSLGYNLNADGGGAVLDQPTDQNGTDPLLGPLAYYGGPTPTHILLTGSPAINKGKNFSGATTDQRGPGFPRTVGSAAVAGGDGTDVGAFERQANDVDPTLIVTTTDDTNANNTCDPANPCSLRDAITAANTSGPDDVIDFAVTGTITLNSNGALPNLNSNMQILGPAANALAVKRDPTAAAFSIFAINNGMTVTISGLTISGGFANFPGGGGINNFHANLTLNSCTVSGNSSPSRGGGIYNDGSISPPTATLTINNSTVSGNSVNSGGAGGGIYNDGGGTTVSPGGATLTINNSTVSGNSAPVSNGLGGGIYNVGSSDGSSNGILTVNNSTISGNSSSNLLGGGAIYNNGADATVNLTSTILNAGATGGTIFNFNGYGTVTSHGYNLSSNAEGGDATTGPGGFLNQTGDQRNTDPMLDPNGLQNNGGPTLTIALQPSSPAIDKGKDFTGSPNDQRGPGFARTIDDPMIMNATGGDGTDIGAFEKQTVTPCPQVLTATVNDSVTGTGLNQWDYTSGGWSYYTAANFFTAFQKDEHYAFTTGVKAHFRFHGNQVKIYTVKEPQDGFIHYTLDGGTLDDQLVDNYSASQTGNTLSYTSPIVPVGDHDLVVEVNGTHGAGSSNTITVDKAEVYDAICAPPPPVQALAATINDNTTGTGNNQFDYSSGGWSYYSNNSFNTAFQKDEHYAFTTGVFALFRFNGTQVKVYTVKEPAGGNIRYTLDGGTDVQVADNFSPTQMGNTLSYTSPVVSSGNHVLKIEVLGTHNMGSSNTITIDKAEVYISSVGPSLTATVNDNTTGNGNNQFDYSGGGWNYYSNPGFTTAFQMDEHYAFGTGVLAHFRFNGTQVKIYTVKEPAGGRIRYVLDTNVDIQTISNYSPTQVGNSLSYTSPVVPAGNHDLIIQVDGTHEPSASSNTITVDKAEVFNGP